MKTLYRVSFLKSVCIFYPYNCPYSSVAHIPPYQKDYKVEEEFRPIQHQVGNAHKRKKRLHVCGLTITGALGIKPAVPKKDPILAARSTQPYPYRLRLDNISKFDCGYGFSVFTSKHKDTIKAWGCGINTDSQIGFHKDSTSNEAYSYLMEPSPIPLPLCKPLQTRVTDVSCGRAHTVICTDNEGMFAMGNNAFGQCGRPIIEGEVYALNRTINNISDEPFSSRVEKVVCGMDHTLFLTENGDVFSCGWGADGQTGLGHLEKSGTPTLVKGDLQGVKITQVSSFADTSIALSDCNDVFGWGSSEYRQLACVSESTQICTPTRLPFTKQGKITQIAAGGTACLLLNDRGEVWVWGYGILGKGPNLDSSVWPRRIPPTLFGLSDFNPNVHVTKISAGLGHFMAITNKGELYAWGKNKSGCLGINSGRDMYFPWRVLTDSEVTHVKLGVDHSVIMSKDFV